MALLTTTLSAYLAVSNTLRENTASLLRPKAPKAGSRIFLERIKPIWNNLGFKNKLTARNIFRYKSRMLMTILGVAGCMGLLMLGFGMKFSISKVLTLQYDEIIKYDISVVYKEEPTIDESRALGDYVLKNDNVVKIVPILQDLLKLEIPKQSTQDVLLIVDMENRLDEVMVLRNPNSNEILNIGDSGIIITEKLAKMLGVKEGDTISFKTEKDGNSTAETKVLAVVENYIYHYIYMTPTAYKNLFGDSAALNTLLLRSSAQDNSELSKQLLKIDGITSVTMNIDTQKQVDEAMKNLNIIVALMIISAGLLAVVVLYNLNNINITERRRELATLKVLGFYDGELERYVFRENIILTVVGMILGIIIGVVLHFFIMRSVETDTMMFGRQIKWYSYIFSIVLTVAFTILVNALMSIKLRKIDMIESLKSTE